MLEMGTGEDISIRSREHVLLSRSISCPRSLLVGM